VGLGTVDEGVYTDGRWVPGRRLNGDETPEWKALRFQADNYGIQRVKFVPLSLKFLRREHQYENELAD